MQKPGMLTAFTLFKVFGDGYFFQALVVLLLESLTG